MYRRFAPGRVPMRTKKNASVDDRYFRSKARAWFRRVSYR